MPEPWLDIGYSIRGSNRCKYCKIAPEIRTKKTALIANSANSADMQ